MARLTNTQINHLTQRIEEIIHKMMLQEITELGPQPKVLDYTFEEKLQLIRTRRATLRRDDLQNYRQPVTYFFLYPETTEMKRAKASLKSYQRAVAAINDKYHKQKIRLTDEAILGDSATAMELLSSLEQQAAQL